MAFSGSSTALNLGETAGDITVNVPQAGECTLSIDLSNPQQWTVSVEEGSIEPEPEPEPGESDLFISEYVEAKGNNKYIEVYNPTNVTVDLSAYSLKPKQ